ncbi:hypothetical protein AHAS_Ahas08G0175200 [Arachis hypogaea]
MPNSKSMPIPVISSLKLVSQGSSPFENPKFYRFIVRGLHNATLRHTKIIFAVNRVSQFIQNPIEHHWCAVKAIKLS